MTNDDDSITRQNETHYSFSALILIAVLLIDMILSIFFPILKEQLSSAWGVILFIVITCLYRDSTAFYSEVCKKQN